MSIKHYLIILITIVASVHLKAQYKYEFGGLFGGTVYMGDANPANLFSDVGTLYGALARYNINYRSSIKANVYRGSISGSVSANDPNFPGVTTDLNFATNYFDVGVNYEYNFFPYTYDNEPGASPITPYVFGGLGVTYVNRAIINIPFGLGFKYMLTPRVNIGAEVGIRKVFADNIENRPGLDNPDNIDGSVFINNDYISTFGFYVTMSFSKRCWQCLNREN